MIEGKMMALEATRYINNFIHITMVALLICSLGEVLCGRKASKRGELKKNGKA